MSRLIPAFEQMFDGSGDPLVSGLIDFFESGSSSVRKNTFSDSGETAVNANPLVLKGDGRVPNVFGTGTYRAILRTSAGVQVLQRDPIGGDVTLQFGSDWVPTQIYSITDVVRDGGDYWESLINNNLDNKPSTDSGTNWQKAIINIGDVTTEVQRVTDQVFDTVALMVASTELTVGMTVSTSGYLAKGDGGDNRYEIVAAATGTVDGGSFIDLTGIAGQAKGLFPGGIVNVNQFGAAGDGVAVDDPAIQAAIDFRATDGGQVFALVGKYLTSTTITIPAGVTFIGAGRSNAASSDFSTRITPNFNGDAFLLTGAWAKITNMTIAHTGTPTSGAAVRAEDIADPQVTFLYIVGMFNGILFTACNTPVCNDVQNINLVGSFGFKTEGTAGLGNSDSHLFINISGGFLAAGPADFKHLVHGDFTNSGKTIGFRFVKGDFGVVMEGTTDDPDDIWFSAGGCDNQVKDGFRFTTGQNLFLTDTWAGQSGESGYVFAAGFAGNVAAKGIRSRGSENEGIIIAGGSNFHLSESLVGQNGGSASDTFAGLKIDDATKVTISGGTYGTLPSGGANQQKQGILCTGTTDNVRVQGANLSGNLTDGFGSSASGTDIFVNDCIGHITEAYERESAAFTGTTYSFPHGLANTPDSVNLTLASTAQDDRLIPSVTVDSTNITFSIYDITSAALLSSGTHAVFWEAKVKF